MSRHRKLMAVSLGAALAAVLVTATTAYATLAPGTTVTGSLAPGTNMTFAGSINGVALTVTCTTFSGSGQTPSSPSKTVTLSAPPTISGCSDTLGGTDTIVTNANNGPWKLTASGKKGKYKLALDIPKAGATFTSNVLSSCVITAEPKKAGKVTGKYDGNDTTVVTNAPIKTQGSGCSSSTASSSATVVLSPAPGPPPF